MIRKVAVWGAVAIAAFYLVAAPNRAAHNVARAGSMLGHAAHQVSVFLTSIG